MLHRIPNFHECDICRKNVSSAEYYCHDCTTIFCDACVISEKESITVCSECGMNLLAVDTRTGEYYCKQCHDDGVIESRLVPVVHEKNVCPNCKSSNTSDIIELKSKLKEKYKNVVLDCRNVLDDFHNFANFLSLVKQKMLKIRLEQPRIVLDLTMEDEMISVMKEAVAIQQRILNRLKDFFMFLGSKKKFFFSNQGWRNEDFSSIETYMRQLQSDYLVFIAQSADQFNQPIDILQMMKERLEFMGELKEFSQALIMKGILNLQDKEYPMVFIDDVKLDTDEENTKSHGNILVTNKNFYFIKEQGVWKKVETLQFSYPLNKYIDSETRGRLIKHLHVQFQGIELKFHMDKEKMHKLTSYIDKIFANTHELNQEKIHRIKSFDVNSIFQIKAFIERAINDILSPSTNFDCNIQSPGKNVTSVSDGVGMASMGLGPRNGLHGATGFHGERQDFAHEQHQARNRAMNEERNHMEVIQDNIMKFNDFHQRMTNHDGYQHGNANNMDEILGRNDMVDDDHCMNRSQCHGMRMNDSSSFPEFDLGRENFRMPGDGGGSRASEQQHVRSLMILLKSFEQKKVSIRETLTNLENKFDRGKIGPNVYFHTHQLFREKLIGIQQEIQHLKNQLSKIGRSRGYRY